MTRLEATKQVLARLDREPIVASLGHPAYDLFAARDRGENFYTWGSMGLASSIGLGLAIARPDLRVFVLDGDGSLLMNLGSLATVGWVRPENLVIVVWDNGEYGTRRDVSALSELPSPLDCSITVGRAPPRYSPAATPNASSSRVASVACTSGYRSRRTHSTCDSGLSGT